MFEDRWVSAYCGALLVGMVRTLIHVVALIAFVNCTQAEVFHSNTEFLDWTYQCAREAEGESNCALVQTVIDPVYNLPVASLSIAKSFVDGDVIISVLVPLGVEISQPATLWIDGHATVLPFRTCLIQGCLGRHETSRDIIQRLSLARNLEVSVYLVGQSQSVSFNFSNAGLLDAIAAMDY